ncbi:MAG: hypothetical protein ACO37B_07370, partial [Arenicellales bacterium]
ATVMAAAFVLAAIFSSLMVETGAELVIEKYFTDDEPGALAIVSPGAPSQIVNLSPQATIIWLSPDAR